VHNRREFDKFVGNLWGAEQDENNEILLWKQQVRGPWVNNFGCTSNRLLGRIDADKERFIRENGQRAVDEASKEQVFKIHLRPKSWYNICL
jgi:hypothetical protein